MRRLIAAASILMATASLAPLSAGAVDCKNVPPQADVPDEACNAIPAQGCRGPLPPDVCRFLPAQPPNMSTGADQNVLAANNSFSPNASSIVPGQRLIFQNLDFINHSLYYVDCQTPEGRTCFQFAPMALEIGSYGARAKALNISPNSYYPGQVYSYKCGVHGFAGTFTVVAP